MGVRNGIVIEFGLYGPLDIRDQSGSDLRPRLLKSRAVLAVLAGTPGHRHTRSWLQNLLWEDRQPQQAKSSLRSALADIRRSLGDHSAALISDHYEVALDQTMIRVRPRDGAAAMSFLEGFDVPNADEFEDWLRTNRSMSPPKVASAAVADKVCPPQLYLVSSGQSDGTMTQIQIDALADCIGKAVEDLRLASVYDRRGLGALEAHEQGSDDALILKSEAAESQGKAFSRLKLMESRSGKMLWSRSLIGEENLDLGDPNSAAIVADFVEALTDSLIAPIDWENDKLSPGMLAAAGMSHIFKLGDANFRTADLLLKRSYFQDPDGCTMAWRALLRTFLIGEQEYENRDDVIGEGLEMAARALEAEPRNSMVLALCAHVENMLNDNYEQGFDLAARALSLNRCNPFAWASLGRAAATFGEAERGKRLAQYGAKLAQGTRYSFLLDTWASSTGLLAQDLVSARYYGELSHSKAPSFAPPLRLLTALYCAESEFDRASKTAQKLRLREPDFNMQRFREDGYPNQTVRQAQILDSLPLIEI